MPSLFVLLAGLFGFSVLGAAKTVAKISSLEDSPDFTKYDGYFKLGSKNYGVPWKWIKAVSWIESAIGTAPSVKRGLENPSDAEASKSSDGKSWGIMQVTLTTAQELRPGTTVADLNNPAVSIDLGSKYLGKMFKKFNGDQEKTIRAYNGGPGFMSTIQGRTLTPIYYQKFVYFLSRINEKQKG